MMASLHHGSPRKPSLVIPRKTISNSRLIVLLLLSAGLGIRVRLVNVKWTLTTNGTPTKTTSVTNNYEQKTRTIRNSITYNDHQANSATKSMDYIPTRIWNYTCSNYSWCTLPADSTSSTTMSIQGLLYIKLPKCASSTAAGVTLRIADTIGQWRGGDKNKCACRYRHGTVRSQGYRHRNPNTSFLWTSIRHPASRTLSAYFFYHVSRRHVNATEDIILAFLQKQRHKSFYVNYLALNMNHGERIQQSHIQDILHGFDFMAISERLPESLVVLSLLLQIPIANVVLLSNSKMAGGYDGGRSKRFKCAKIQHKWTTPTIDRYLLSRDNDDFLVDNWDYFLYQAANASLDRTIDELGRSKVEAGLELYHAYQTNIQNQCSGKAIFPCPITIPNQTLLSQQDCYFSDAGCGYKCIDKVLRKDAIMEWSNLR